ncbi:hypothetical protein GCM10010182_76890 [Actinomadura cremea]|nr:hypothetical protein GCM10010182_76890 [Actinomadura cremea]
MRTYRARIWPVLLRQLRSLLLIPLAVTAVASFFLGGGRGDAVIIGIILSASVGLGFGNEYRAEKTAEALHVQDRCYYTVWRDGLRYVCPGGGRPCADGL